MKLDACVFSAYIFRIVISCYWIFFLMGINYSSLFIISWGKKSILSDIRIGIPFVSWFSFLGIPFLFFYSRVLVDIVDCEWCFLEAAKRWIMFSDPVC